MSGGRLLEAKGLNLLVDPNTLPMMWVRLDGPAARGELKVGDIRIGYTR